MPLSVQNSNAGALGFFKQYCGEEWIPLIAHYQQIIKVEKNDTFINEGDSVSGIFVLLEGKAKVVSRFHGKREHILRLAGNSMIVGHRGLFLKTYTISAVALTNCEVAFIPMNLFFQLHKANTAFSLYMLEFFSQELHESEEQQYMLTIDNVRQRIAFCLVKLIRIFGYEKPGSRKLDYTLPRKDIATLCNTTYESVIRTLSVFEKEKLIEGVGKTILILNEGKLRTIAAGSASH
jgi:CRP-like cAMP-binding protein